jgi:hypothetical protein
LSLVSFNYSLAIVKTQIFLWLLWAIFIGYTLLLSPLDRPGTLTVIEKMLKFQLAGINPYLATVFAISDSRWTGVLLLLTTIWLLGWADLNGDWGDFLKQWHEISFVHLISWDCSLMAVIFPSLLGDDMARRGLADDRIFGQSL